MSEKPEALALQLIDESKLKRVYNDEYEPDLGWMEQRGEWGMKAQPGKRGLTLDDVESGSYAEVPDLSENQTGRMRGSMPREGAYHVGYYTIRNKTDIWLNNAASLYEEAVQRQWSSATDIPWETIKPLPDDIERAECQLATFLTEIEFVAADVPGRWVSATTPDYFEPRLFLIAQVADEARHLVLGCGKPRHNVCSALGTHS